MKQNMRKGQAALEFLTTYGWAFMVILVVIGALAYFGVTNPLQFVPERCTFQQELACQDFQLVTETNDLVLRFYVQNSLGKTITIPTDGFTVTAPSVSNSVSTTCPLANTTVSASASKEIECRFAGIQDIFPPAGEKIKFSIQGTYQEVGGYYPSPFVGELLVTRQ